MSSKLPDLPVELYNTNGKLSSSTIGTAKVKVSNSDVYGSNETWLAVG
jgi:hypothetical protein